MQCREFDARMHELLDARQHPEDDALLIAHTTSCSECGDVLAAQTRLFRGLKQAYPALPERTDRVLAALPAPPARKKWPTSLFALAVASSLLLALLMLPPAAPRRSGPHQQPLAPGSIAIGRPGRPHAQQNSASDSWDAPRQQDASYRQQWEAWMSGAQYLDWYSPSVSDPFQVPLQPIASSLTTVWTVLWRTIPITGAGLHTSDNPRDHSGAL